MVPDKIVQAIARAKALMEEPTNEESEHLMRVDHGESKGYFKDMLIEADSRQWETDVPSQFVGFDLVILDLPTVFIYVLNKVNHFL